MQWIILGCGLLMLFLLTRKKRVFRPLPPGAPGDGSASRLAEIAKQQGGYGYARVPIQKGLLSRLEGNIRYLNRFSADDLLPAARRLCDNGRFLQQEAADAILAHKALPKLPRSQDHIPRICLFAREVVLNSVAALTTETLRNAMAVWQEHLPMTAEELEALPTLLRLTLMEEICNFSQQCRQDQTAQAAASQAHLLHKHGKIRSAQKLVHQYAQEPSFWEELLRMEEPADWMGNEYPDWRDSPEKMACEEHDRQAENSRRIANAILSVRAVGRMPWERLTEEASVIHQILKQDPVYPKMDAQSRREYIGQAARMARQCRRSERAVCDAAMALCRSAASKSIASHVGYYLLDEGRPLLLAQLHALTPARRLEGFVGRHACVLFQIVSWTALIALLGVGFFNGYAIAMLIPFALVFLCTVQQWTLGWIQTRTQACFIPRMEVERLSADLQVLVVCPVTLTDASQALSMVKRLSVMHEANPDRHLHFMLLGDFQDSLTATLGTDAQIIATASSAINALCENTGHSFFYFQRERSYAPGEKTYRGRERRQGALETLLRLVQGRSIQDSFAFASIDPAALQGRYRYVITLDNNVLLPPGSALLMTGAILHPLQKRRMHDGRMRGVSIVRPRMQTAPHLMQTRLSQWLGHAPQARIDTDTYDGTGIIDPAAFLDAVQGFLPEGRLLSPELPEGSLAGCACAKEIVLFDGFPQTLRDVLSRLHRRTRGNWQLIPCLLPLVGYPCRKGLGRCDRNQIRRNLLLGLCQPLQLMVMLYAAFTGREWLLIASMLLPQLTVPFSPFSDSCRRWLVKLAMLPCEAFIQADAIGRTLYQLAVSRQHLLDLPNVSQFRSRYDQPSMLFFGISMTFAGLFAALPLLLGGAWTGLIPSLVWAAFPFLLPMLEQKQTGAEQPTGYMREMLLRLAQHTLTCFETAIDRTDHGLPPESVQIEPKKGISHRTSPTGIGLYLCGLIAANKMNLLSTAEMVRRMEETVYTLEALPKWHGLFFNRYDTQTLAPIAPAVLSSQDCGTLAVCLLTCAQGVRTLLPEMDCEHHDLASRLDRLCDSMELERLYDVDADLFWTGLDATKGTVSFSHHALLASESRLLSYVSIMLRRVPLRHWSRLGRPCTSQTILLSQSGGMAGYLMPVLFQPLIPRTLLERSCRQVLRLQRCHRLGGAFGVSESGYHAFDPGLNYLYADFGLSQLALEANVQNDVLAPYASMLCLPIQLKAAFQNLQRLQRLGLEGPLGLFEAADFSPARTEGKSMAVVRAHLAHHQGMILCAVCNALCENYIANLFSSLPRVQAYGLLLNELPGCRRSLIRHPLRRMEQEFAAQAALLKREAVSLCFPMDVHLLCGAETSLLIDAQGGGYLKHGETMITRFHQSCSVPSGIRLYLRDSQTGAYWLATDPHLTRRVSFEAAQAFFQAERFGISSELRIWIDPLDGSCIHCLTLQNTQDTERVMEVCSYLEPALCGPDEAEAQPDCELLPFWSERLSPRGAAVTRRAGENSAPVHRLWHVLCTRTALDMFRMQTDRVSFLGRGRSILSPRAMDFPISAVADSLGDVLDPCLSLRGQFTLAPKGTAVFCFVTHMPGEQESSSAFCDRHAQPDEMLRTFESAQTRSAVTVRYLRLTQGMQESISRMLGRLAYQGQPITHRPNENPLPMRNLQRFGLSPQVPLLLYTCCGSINEPMLKLLLSAHAFYRVNGFAVDLVLLVQDCSRRAQVIADAQAAIEASHSREVLNQRGGIHLLSQLSPQEELLLHSAARLTLSSGGGTLEQQLTEESVSVRARPLYLYRSAAQWKQQQAAESDALFHNGYGGFVTETGHYQITLPPGRMTPAPWCNPLRSPRFCTFASESGLLSSFLPGIPDICLVHCGGDGVTPRSEENFFVRDEQNALIWSLTRLPLGHNASVRVTHAPGETTYESNGYGITAQLTCFTDAQETAGLRMLHIQNDSQTERTLTLFHTCRLAAEGGQQLSMQCTDGRAWCFVPHANGWAGLCAIDPEDAQACAMPIGWFQGLWSIVPFALSCLEQLPQAGGDTAILRWKLHLHPGESRTLTTTLVYGATQEDFETAVASVRSSGATNRLREVRSMWEARLNVLQFDLPDQALGLLLSRWLPCQAQAGLDRDAGSGAVWELLALLTTHPQEAYTRILQDEQIVRGAQGLFLPYAVAAYIEVTADESILSQRRSQPQKETDETLLSRCLRILESQTFGAHDLPVTDEGTETVWLGMLLCESLRRLAPYCDSGSRVWMNARREALLTALDRSAWDGGWYLRGWSSEGRRLGAAENGERGIDLLTQCWAVMCGANRQRSALAMESVWRLLYEKDAGLLRTASGCVPGETEAQVTQTACLAMGAYHQLGQDERAWELLGALMPVHHASTRQLAARYHAEPYIMAACVYSAPHLRGRGGLTWDRGSAACFWHIAVEQLLGLCIRGGELRFRPVVPQSWDDIRLTLRQGGATYHLRARRDCTLPTAEGQPLPDGVLPLTDDGRIHEAVFPLRSGNE